MLVLAARTPALSAAAPLLLLVVPALTHTTLWTAAPAPVLSADTHTHTHTHTHTVSAGLETLVNSNIIGASKMNKLD